jgi:hypothetical protein
VHIVLLCSLLIFSLQTNICGACVAAKKGKAAATPKESPSKQCHRLRQSCRRNTALT